MIPDAGEGEHAVVLESKGVRLFFVIDCRPFVEPIRRDDTPAMLEGFAPNAAGGEFIGIGIDRVVFEFDGLRPIGILLANYMSFIFCR